MDIRLNFDNLSISYKIIIMGWIEVLSIKAYEYEGDFYYEINKGQPKKIKKDKRIETEKEKVEIKPKKDKKTDYISLIDKCLGVMPNISICGLSVKYSIKEMDSMYSVLTEQGINVAKDILLSFVYPKIKFDSINISQDNKKSGSQINVIMLTKFELIKIISYIMHILKLKNKYTISVNS